MYEIGQIKPFYRFMSTLKIRLYFFLYCRTPELKENFFGFIVFLYFLEFKNPFSREKWQWPPGAGLNLDKSYTFYGEKYQAI